MFFFLGYMTRSLLFFIFYFEAFIIADGSSLSYPRDHDKKILSKVESNLLLVGMSITGLLLICLLICCNYIKDNLPHSSSHASVPGCVHMSMCACMGVCMHRACAWKYGCRYSGGNLSMSF